MRIISGLYRSRKLITPDSYDIRPTADRAKETLFNILENHFDFKNIVCLDLFCGTGNLGLECISRGAVKCYFVDKDIRLVKKNIENLKAEKFSKTIKSDAEVFLENNTAEKFDLIFCDPPFSYNKYEQLLNLASGFSSVFILEHAAELNFENRHDSFLLKKKKIGIIYFSIFDFRKKS